MPFEEEDETFDWIDQDDEAHIPVGLKERWRHQEAVGLRAGVCRACGFPFTEDDLSCRHCDAPIEIPHGALDSLKHWFFRTPMGILLLIGVFAALLSYLLPL